MGISYTVEVRDDVTIVRCECDGIAPTMHTIMNSYIAADPGNFQAEINRIKAKAEARLAAKQAAEAAVNGI